MKKTLVIKVIICLFISTIFYSCRNNQEHFDSNQEILKNNSDKNISSFNFLPKSTTNDIIVHDNYTLSYNEKYEQAEWVAYQLTPKNISHNDFNRPFFIEDPQVRTGSADWKNYKHSGYDKGHLCPAGDMRFSKKAYDDTFYTSNISPQDHDFNNGIWNTLEGKVRYWAKKYNGIYVATGGVLNDNLETIGSEDVAVPEYFYKVLLRKDNNGNYKMIGFLMPGHDSTEALYKFVVPVDKIEAMTGIDFYPQLDDKIENLLEKNSDYKDWSFN